MRKLKIILLCTPMLMMVSCGNQREKADIANVNIEPVNILRLDRDVFAMDTSKIASYTPDMQEKYGNFYSTYLFGIINTGDIKDSAYKALAYFVKDKDMMEMNRDVNSIFNEEELKKISGDLETAFRYHKFHFPKRALPKKVVAFESGFNYNITTSDSTLGLGLDMYLGDDNKFYTMLQWPRYKVSQLRKEYLVSDAMRGWIINEFDTNEPINNLLHHMIFYGKLYYCVDEVLPDTPDSIKIGYTTQQMEYCNANEKSLWVFFTEKERLYKNDLKEIAEYTSEGPFTSAISKECPPRIAMYIGWRIVKSYMDKNSQVSLEDLMNTKDAQLILSKSKYRP